MKAFITGGTGFIGSHLVDQLLKKGDNEVRCLIRGNHKWLLEKKITSIKGDLHDIDALMRGMNSVDVVFHLAGVVKAPEKHIFYRNNVDATENILRAAQRCDVKKIIILSSLAAAGPSFKRPVNESDPLMPVSMYGESKKAMEEMIHKTTRDTDSITIIRPPAVYGPREDQIYSVFKSASLGLFPIVGDGKTNKLSLVYVDDLVEGILAAANQLKPGVSTYFISSEDLYTWNQIKDVTAEVLSKKLIPLRVKPGLVKKLSGIVEDVSSIFGKYPVLNRDKANEMVLEWTCSINKAKDELNYRQSVSLKDGIAKTIAWYKIHNWI